MDSTPAATSDAASTSSSASPAGTGAPTNEEWCASYATLTSVLSQSASDATGAHTALQALERFDLLWGIADNMGILTAAEVAANQRAVASYRAVMSLMASGRAAASAEVSSARAALTAQTTTDHTLLASSAGKVVGLCGAPTPSSSP
jgi:GTP cyclohydrolase III